MAVETRVSSANVRQEPSQQMQTFWKKYSKPAAIVLAVLIIGFGGWFAYNAWVIQPKEEKAQDAIFKAQQYFAQDSLRLALNGDGVNKGFLYIIKNYGGTKTANLAKYYAGICDLKLGSYNEAITYLTDFSTDSKPVQMMTYGSLGDAYSELNKKSDAINAYQKAATTFEDDKDNSAEYLFRAALLSEVLGKNKEALDLYKQLKDKFPGTVRGSQADKYIYRLNIEPNANDLSVN